MAAKKRRTYHHGNLRDALVSAATQLITEHGTDELSMRELARRVGVDHRAAYFHFADRSALLTEVAEQGFTALIADIERELAKATDTLARFLAFARAYIDFALAQPGRYRVMMSPRPGIVTAIREHDAADRALDILSTEVRAGIARGELADVDPLLVAIQVWSQLHGIADLLVNRRLYVRPPSIVAYTQQIIELALRGTLRR
ncbi:MAG TPA: TetR/AcrR family transcriptional regulator [Kofleriaceae bacterium]|jgi:AcrR family transcriptional regulator